MAKQVVTRGTDVDREVVVDRRGGSAGAGTTLLTWLALLLAIAALGLAWAAYNRTGEDLQDQAQEQLNEAAEEVDQRTETEIPNR